MSNGDRGGASRLPVRKEDLSRLAPETYGRADIARMLDAADPARLREAAAAWDAAAGLLTTLHDNLRARAEVLAVDWDGAAAAACQFALRRIAGTARQLSRYAEDLRAALSTAAEAQQRAKQQIAAFRGRPTLLGGIEVGGTGAAVLEGPAEPDLAERLDATARQWMRTLYDGYRSAMAALPDEVAFDLPGLVVPDLPGPPATVHTAPARPGTGEPGSDRPATTGANTGGPVGEPEQAAPPHTAPVALGIPVAEPAQHAAPQPAPVAAAVPVGDSGQGVAPQAVPVAAGALYGGAAEQVSGVLPGGVGAVPLPPDLGRPVGAGWPGGGESTVTGGLGATLPAGTAAVGPPAGQLTPAAAAGSIVGAVAEAVAGADQHRHAAEPIPGAVPDVHQPPQVPPVDAPYVAATVAAAVAAAQQHDPGAVPAGRPGMQGDQGPPAPQAPAPPLGRHASGRRADP